MDVLEAIRGRRAVRNYANKAPPGSIIAKSVVVAWKNTCEARRAVSDALPLLIAAESVTFLRIHPDVDPDHDARTEEAVVARLRRQGVQAFAKTMEQPENDAYQALTTFAVKHQAGLIVSGAYGHSRFGEWGARGNDGEPAVRRPGSRPFSVTELNRRVPPYAAFAEEHRNVP